MCRRTVVVEVALSGDDQESIVIEAWTTGAERQQELIDGLLELFKRFRASDGFVEARILKGSGGTTVLSYLRMRSAADEQRLHEEPGIQAALEALRKIARPHRDLFDLVWVFTPLPTKGRSSPRAGRISTIRRPVEQRSAPARPNRADVPPGLGRILSERRGVSAVWCSSGWARHDSGPGVGVLARDGRRATAIKPRHAREAGSDPPGKPRCRDRSDRDGGWRRPSARPAPASVAGEPGGKAPVSE